MNTSWIYQNKKITDIEQFPKNTFGFVYKIIIKYNNVLYTYYGKKNLYSVSKKKLPKSKLSSDKRLKNYEIITKESNWKTYTGSSKELNDIIKNNKDIKIEKHILKLCNSDLILRYEEIKVILENDCLMDKYNFNKNIQIKILKKLHD